MAVKKEAIEVKPLRFGQAVFHVEGIEPLMTHKFSSRIKEALIKEREEEQTTPAKGGKKTYEQADYEARGREAMYTSTEGWHGIHAAAFRNAAISVCRLTKFKMTHAKLSIFIKADGHDRDDGTPLVRLIADEPRIVVMPVRNDNGAMDLRARPMWAPGWKAEVHMLWDLDQFTINDITNLMRRVGRQVGIGEGRPDSRESAGLGYGMFDVRGVVAERNLEL